MTIYRIWVISLSNHKLIYSRHFPHVEKRDDFIFPIITYHDFLRSLFSSLGIEYQQQSKTNQTKEYHQSNATISNIDSIEYSSQLSRSSSSCSLSSVYSSSTIMSSIVGGGRFSTASGESNLDKMITSSTHSDLFNYLPLIVCRFMNNPPDMMSSMTSSVLIEEHQKQLAYVDLVLLVYEKNGYLFVCCPRLVSSFNMSAINDDQTYEQLLLEEDNISLSYSALQLISSTYFKEHKSIKHLELFISSSMPFGTLIKDKLKFDSTNFQQISKKKFSSSYSDIRNEGLIRLCFNEFVSTSFQNLGKILNQNETIFGSLTIDNQLKNIKNLSKAEVILSISNLGAFSFAKPINCDVTNISTLIFDLKHSKLDPFNIFHYRLKSMDEEIKHSSSTTTDSESANQNNGKVFSYRYIITRKVINPSNVGRNYLSTKNCHHVTLTLQLNSKFAMEELRFSYFLIKFSLNQGRAKNDIQTADSSISNLIVRESIRTNFGQVRSEGANFQWVIGQKVPKTGKMSLDFDLLINEDKIENMETICNFRFEQKFAYKLTSLKKGPNNFDEVRECQVKLSSKLLEPQINCSKLTLFTEIDRNQFGEINVNERKSDSSKISNVVLLEYRLNSFEYRLFPELHPISNLQ
ncbi:hypothetical protein BLOT_006153 [Blomia tropicalis]|nr:hypothetical protein BLOT_006153 [Blomia tropicalis]